jgi:hypothetical protein
MIQEGMHTNKPIATNKGGQLFPEKDLILNQARNSGANLSYQAPL